MKNLNYKDVSVPVSNLEIGMLVVALDRPWEETSFLLQSFIICSREEIHQLQEQCNYVYVQVRVEQLEEFQNSIKKKSGKTLKTSDNQGPETKTRVNYLNKVGFDEAVASSHMTFKSAHSMAAAMMDGLRVGHALNVNECREVVENIVSNVLDNKDALKFLTLIKNKDNYTAEHSMNVCILSATFARHLGLLEYEIKNIALCGLLHDVGKSKIPEEILNKPGKLTQEEGKLMSEHAIHGRNILMSLKDEDRHAVDVAHSHHERIDGTGYPRALSSTQIPYYAKVVSIVDAYDAMTSERCYGKARSSVQALRIILENAGKQFDLNLAKEFTACIGLYNAGSLVQLKSGQIAIVTKANEVNHLRPKIMVVTDQNQVRRNKQLIIDLDDEKYQSVHIEKELANGTAGINTKKFIESYIKQVSSRKP